MTLGGTNRSQPTGYASSLSDPLTSTQPPAGGSDEAVPAILTPSKAFWIKPANAVAVFRRLGSRHTATCSGADRMAVGRHSPGHSPASRSNAPALIISAIRGGVSLPGSASSTSRLPRSPLARRRPLGRHRPRASRWRAEATPAAA
jgi:hypothetical protein